MTPSVDNTLLWYLAGPITGYPGYNYPAFSEACKLLRLNSLNVVSPHEVPWPEDHLTMSAEDLWQYMMENTRTLLDQADGVILLPGWAHSRGVLIELGIAAERKLIVLFYDPRQSELIGM